MQRYFVQSSDSSMHKVFFLVFATKFFKNSHWSQSRNDKGFLKFVCEIKFEKKIRLGFDIFKMKEFLKNPDLAIFEITSQLYKYSWTAENYKNTIIIIIKSEKFSVMFSLFLICLVLRDKNVIFDVQYWNFFALFIHSYIL